MQNKMTLLFILIPFLISPLRSACSNTEIITSQLFSESPECNSILRQEMIPISDSRVSRRIRILIKLLY